VVKNSTVGIHQLNNQSTGSLRMQVFPNPNDGDFSVKFYLKKQSTVKLSLHNLKGEIIQEELLKNLGSGENIFERKLTDEQRKGTYFITLETPYEKATQKIILR
jgi:hypothetical protein